VKRILKKRIWCGLAALLILMSSMLPAFSVRADGKSAPSETESTFLEESSENIAEESSEIAVEESSEIIVEESSEKAVDETADVPEKLLTYKSIKADSDSDATIVLDGIMPQNADATAVDVTDERSGEGNVLAAFDITVKDGEEEFQPEEGSPINVQITDERISTDSETVEVWHILDDGTRVQVTGFTLEEGKISFAATGFSVYEIVEVETVVPIVNPDVGWQRVGSLSDLLANAQKGFIISNPDRYFVTGNEYQVPTKNRWGLLKTSQVATSSDANVFCDRGVAAGAETFYIEDASLNEGQLKGYVYFMNGTSKVYIQQSVVPDGGCLRPVASKEEATLFTIETHTNADAYDFFIAVGDTGTNRYTWNQQGNSGGKGFATFNNTGDNNARLYFWYFVPGDKDPYGLDGLSTGLMEYIDGGVGRALMADQDSNSLIISDLVVRKESGEKTYYVSGDNDISEWTFHCVEEDKYTISSGNKYLYTNEDGEIFFTEDPNLATIIKVIPEDPDNDEVTGRRIELWVGNKALLYRNGQFGFHIPSENSKIRFDFLEKSSLDRDDQVTYTAKKISVSDTPNNMNVIVYTRIWNDTDKTYEFYAIDHDGSLVRCYERGNNIMWVGDQINTLLWHFTEYYYEGTNTPNNYYELQNTYSGNYLAPQIEGNHVLSDKPIGINLPNRRNGEYYSDILAWDDAYYSYAGIQSDITNNRIKSGSDIYADTFYFATLENIEDHLTEVPTIDNDLYGITMKMVDYPVKKGNEHRQDDVLQGNSYTPGLLNTKLESDGYPIATKTNKSLGILYTGENQGKEVNHLFLQSTYNASGYFEFDSCQNFATLLDENGNVKSDFTVYKQLGTSEAGTSRTLLHGQFFPYNTIQAGKYSSKTNLYGALANLTDPNAGVLPESDPRKYEKLYDVGTPNYYNGMEMSASFVQTPNGKDDWGHDIIFEFTGDDDFWLYVDDELVIDLGGIHSALAGNVNFATGRVFVNGTESTLRDVFRNNYKKRNPSAGTDEINSYLRKFFAWDDEKGDFEPIFKDYSTHKMKIFYMERGAGASNLHMRFNLSYVTPGSVTLSKTVSGTDDLDFDIVDYPFNIYYKDPKTGVETLLANDMAANIGVTYQNWNKQVKYKETYTPPNSTKVYHNVFFLNLDKAADIHFPMNTIEYRIVELGVNDEVYKNVSLNGEVMEKPTETIAGSNTRRDYDSGWMTVEERPKMAFDNEVNPDGLRTLYIQKKLSDELGNEIHNDPTTFQFRLSLSKGKEYDFETAYRVKYRVRDDQNFLCMWDSTTQSLVSSGLTDYNSLSREMKEKVTFQTSINGAISKIPAWYTIEVPNLPVDSRFKVEERSGEVPLGYKFDKYEREEGTYVPADGDELNSGTIRVDESPKMYVDNKRGYELSVNKIWSDKNYMSSYDPIYVAVYGRDKVHDDETGEDTYVLNPNRLVNGSIRKIAYPNTSVRVYLDYLGDGETIEDYGIYEVTVTNPVEGDGGVITADTVAPVNDGDLVTIIATAKGGTPRDYNYAVTHEDGTATATSAGIVPNIRTDNVTNTRSGGIVITLYDMNTNKPLADGVFTLMQGNTPVGTYTSDANGRVTILYDFDRDTDYILTQTQSPSGYIGVPNPVTFSVDSFDHVSVTGNEEKWANGRQATGTKDNLVAYIDVYNQPYTLQVIKCDKDTKVAIPGAHFALYRGVDSLSGKVKDYHPMPGFEDLVSDANGILPKIDRTLPAGIYYLTEIAPPAGYHGYDKDISFTLDTKGFMQVDPESGNLFVNEETENGKAYKYEIIVPNKADGFNLTVHKSVEGAFGNKEKEFTFTFSAVGTEANTGIDADTEYSWSKNGIVQSTALKSGDTFTMSHDDDVVIIIPEKADVTISEDSEGYVSNFRLDGETAGEEVSSRTFLVESSTKLTVTNTKTGQIPTGVVLPIGGMVAFALIILSGAVYTILNKRRYQKEL